ncbi:DUF6477 family protein [Pararhodobacter sp. SW119]|uniref:DUF6477 family protein n=1 Tax=Pararhodobacter sp. SW119 TaxID=2780075 RepID=UPI001ADEFFF7|nr:DUF6477 family protein [Pararhodobacter sp. SW119]
MSCHFRDSIVSTLDALARAHRPKLLLRAARMGTMEYRREIDLRRILSQPSTPAPGPAIVRRLIALEAEQEMLRMRPCNETGETWRPARHVDVMIALMAEARLMAEAVEVRAQLLPVPEAV